MTAFKHLCQLHVVLIDISVENILQVIVLLS